MELREYTLYPEHITSYVQATTESSSLRQSFIPLCLFSIPETGGSLLNVVTHLYYYHGGYDERHVLRTALAEQDEWKSYLSHCKPFVQQQESTLWVEAPFLKQEQEFQSTIPGLSSIVLSSQAGVKESTNHNPTTTTLTLPPPAAAPTTTTTSTLLELRRYNLRLGYDTIPQFLNLYQQGISSKLET